MLRFLFFGLKITIKEDINLFTYFDLKPLKNTKIITNNLDYFRANHLNNTTIVDNTIYILGGPLVETKLLIEDDYFRYLDLVMKNNLNHFVYIPHRVEVISERMKSYISDTFEIRKTCMPVETYFLEQNIQPAHVISFFTTAFFTLKKLYPESQYTYLYIPSDKILERKEQVENIYKSIETLNINRING